MDQAALRTLVSEAALAVLGAIREPGGWDATRTESREWDRIEREDGNLKWQALCAHEFKDLRRVMYSEWRTYRALPQVLALTAVVRECPRPAPSGVSTSPLRPHTPEVVAQNAIAFVLKEVAADTGLLDPALLEECARQLLALAKSGVPDRFAIAPVFNLATESAVIQLAAGATLRQCTLQDEWTFKGVEPSQGDRADPARRMYHTPLEFGSHAFYATHALLLTWRDSDPTVLSPQPARELAQLVAVVHLNPRTRAPRGMRRGFRSK